MNLVYDRYECKEEEKKKEGNERRIVYESVVRATSTFQLR